MVCPRCQKKMKVSIPPSKHKLSTPEIPCRSYKCHHCGFTDDALEGMRHHFKHKFNELLERTILA